MSSLLSPLLDPVVQSRLNGDVEKIKSLEESIKEKVLSDIKKTYEKLILVEEEIATKEKIIAVVLQDNTELRYWLRAFENYKKNDEMLKPQYRREMDKNRRWKEMMKRDGYNQKEIDKFDQKFNKTIKEIVEKYEKNNTLLSQAKYQLSGMDAYTSYLDIKKDINKLRKFNLKYIILNRSGVPFINLDEIINYNKDTRIKPTKRQLKGKETKEEFLNRMKKIKRRKNDNNKLKM